MTLSRADTLARRFRDTWHLWSVGLVTFLLIYLSSWTKGYGYFIDEFYYIACALHPAWGYVDHPPLAPLVLATVQLLLGDAIPVVRVLPAGAAAASAFLTGILARDIGAGKFARLVAATAMAAAPAVVAFGGFYSMNAFEPLLATLLLILVVKIVREKNHRMWMAAGVVTGLGIMNKHTFVLCFAALVLSLVVTGHWRDVLNRWFLAGVGCAAIIVSPNLLWQVTHGFPSLEFYRNIATFKNVYTPPGAFVVGQMMAMSPTTVPLWVGGMFYLLVARPARDIRFLSVFFIALFVFMMISGTSRSDRLMFAYPAVFAGGALLVERALSRLQTRWHRPLIIVFLYAGLAVALPVVIPWFDYDTVRSYVETIGLNTEIERGKKPPLPQLLADRIGWHEKYALVHAAVNSLSPEDRTQAIIATGNYGQAGAIELFGRNDSLPPVVCAHNTYYLWSRERLKGTIVLQLAHPGDVGHLRERFARVEQCEGEYASPYVSSHENHLIVCICRGPKVPLREMLDRGKTYR